MSEFKSSPTLRSERREKDEKEMPASERRVHRQLVGRLLWIDRAELPCAVGKASSSLGRASDTDMRNITSILRYLRGNLGIMRVRPTTLNVEAGKRAPVGSELTYGDLDWAGDVDRLSVSGTASWLRGEHMVGTRSPRRAENSQHSHSAVAKLSWSLHSLWSL